MNLNLEDYVLQSIMEGNKSIVICGQSLQKDTAIVNLAFGDSEGAKDLLSWIRHLCGGNIKVLDPREGRQIIGVMTEGNPGLLENLNFSLLMDVEGKVSIHLIGPSRNQL